jgi:hypothetical protein
VLTAMTTVPYVTTAAFKAHPTFLDLLNLRSGDSSAADQDVELGNLLLMASAWADGYCNQPLGAHTRTELSELMISRTGKIAMDTDHAPIVQVTGFGYGYTPSALTTLTDLTQVSTVDDRQIIVYLSGGFGPWSGSLQFGVPNTGSRVWVRAVYVAGYVNTRLVGTPTAGALSITVADATGVVAGGVMRIWEPGSEEAVTVANSYVPGSTTVPLTSGLLYSHTAGMGVSGAPAEIHLAVINYATSLLMRPDTAAEDTYPDARVASGTRIADARKDGSGLVAEAVRLLAPYRRVR